MEILISLFNLRILKKKYVFFLLPTKKSTRSSKGINLIKKICDGNFRWLRFGFTFNGKMKFRSFHLPRVASIFATLPFFLYLSQILYSRIAISLWKSSKGLGRNLQMKNTSTPMIATNSSSTTAFTKQPSKYEKRALNASESEASVRSRLTWN